MCGLDRGAPNFSGSKLRDNVRMVNAGAMRGGRRGSTTDFRFFFEKLRLLSTFAYLSGRTAAKMAVALSASARTVDEIPSAPTTKSLLPDEPSLKTLPIRYRCSR